MRDLCISIHDVAPRTLGFCRAIADAVARVDPALPLTLLVVPSYHGDGTGVSRDYRDWIETRLARGDELALHGYTHLDEAVEPRSVLERLRRSTYTAGEGEFAAVTRDEAAHRIGEGRQWFAGQGWPVHGFVAPAWLMSRGTWEALHDFDFVYTTTLTRFHLLRPLVSLSAPAVVYSARTAFRRIASQGWNSALATVAREASLVRFGFHPADARYPELMAHALGLLQRVARERRALTKLAFARAARSETVSAA